MEQILDFFGRFYEEITVFLFAATPIFELRGAIPLARFYEMGYIKAFLISLIGNLLPLPFAFIFMRKIFDFLRRFKIFKKYVEKFEDRIAKKAEEAKKATKWGLCIFVAIPLPGTGGWTGSFIAAFLEMKLKDAILPIFLGVLIADVFVTAIVYGSIEFLKVLV